MFVINNFRTVSHLERLLQSAIVGDVFALCHATVHVHAHLVDAIPRILVDHALGALLERSDRRVVPPLHHVAVLVELSALVVEAVRDLVSDDNADAAVVERFGKAAAVEERLQNAGRENCGAGTERMLMCLN